MTSKALDTLADEVGAVPRLADQPTSSGAVTVEQPWSPHLVLVLSGGLLTFGLVVCAIMAVLINRGRQSNDVLRAFSLPLILVTAAFLVVTGYSDRQITSVIGLLGAIAGYILGSNGRASEGAKDQKKSSPPDVGADAPGAGH